MRTVELLPDTFLSEAVVELWKRLHDAGLPSLATHTHPTNRPHLTVAVLAELPRPFPALALPIPVTLTAPRMLGRALVLPVRPDAVLVQLRSAFPDLRPWGSSPDPRPWVPHVSLALRMPVGAEVPAMLAGAGPLTGSLVAARSYDTETRTVTALDTRSR